MCVIEVYSYKGYSILCVKALINGCKHTCSLFCICCITGLVIVCETRLLYSHK